MRTSIAKSCRGNGVTIDVYAGVVVLIGTINKHKKRKIIDMKVISNVHKSIVDS